MIIEARNLSYKYEVKPVLDNVSFEIERGMFNAVIGPNGSGKTTLMKIITHIVENYGGRVLYKGTDLSKMSVNARAKEYAYVSQHNHTRFPFTCFDMVMLGKHPHRNRMQGFLQSEIDEITHIMEITETLDFAHKQITQISGGEIQKVILARALAQNPKVLFLDEAFSELDISAKMKTVKLLKQLIKETGLTVISIMHDINTAYSFADKVLALRCGKLVGEGNTHQVMTKEFIKDIFKIDVDIVKGKGFLLNI